MKIFQLLSFILLLACFSPQKPFSYKTNGYTLKEIWTPDETTEEVHFAIHNHHILIVQTGDHGTCADDWWYGIDEYELHGPACEKEEAISAGLTNS